MSRFGETKPVERIKVLPQMRIKKVASKQKILYRLFYMAGNLSGFLSFLYYLFCSKLKKEMLPLGMVTYNLKNEYMYGCTLNKRNEWSIINVIQQ